MKTNTRVMIRLLLIISVAGFGIGLFGGRYPGLAGEKDRQAKYVGSAACQDCHFEKYERFMVHSKKARSYASVKLMKKGLTDKEFRECFRCHTTGYGEPGGFRSEGETPHLMNLSCEVCHGRGSIHVETGDPKDIRGRLTTKHCETCHIPERIASFKYKPLIHSGAH